jgi:D-glycero-D-manno-heptose 1,7-bisphosphate phosphatase
MPHKAFFLDRDGTINVDYNFVHKPEEWTWREGAIKAIRWMNKNHYKVIVVTNQSGIARGRYSVGDVQRLHRWVDDRLAQQNAHIDGWYMAPHHPEHDTDPPTFKPSHRKPDTGMFEEARREFDLDLSRSCMAGDKKSDLLPAVNLEMRCYHIQSGHEEAPDKQFLSQHHIQTFNHLGELVEHLSN